ncbi:hypothetical protein Vretimale_3466 [Volvox reticuliferus]|uniref:Staygreen protein domain-containing protein n=1 Tax=Volvox reticuliferus TaxID=1737510 RepID=A0A8J4BWF7_9CHLO|nr:hypothetical protein Vretifemale_980 [Volvox reticuliferus]GIL98065.1 hypothetical protein Vretimale_3466 [Volvox reticuliferus]
MKSLYSQGSASCTSPARRTVGIGKYRAPREPVENSVSRSSTHHAASTSQCPTTFLVTSRKLGLVAARRRVVSRAFFDPPPFQPEKLAVLLAAGTTALEPAPPLSRKYTLTHNDITGNLRLTIGPEYNDKQISGFYTRLLRDEVVAEWVNIGSSGFALHVYCHVSGQERWLAPPLLRNYIFRREMPLVLDTLVYADRQLLRAQPALAQAQVYVHFQSTVRELDTVEYWGVLGDRSTWPRGPTSILLRMIYAVVGWPPSLSAQPADLSIDLPTELRDAETAMREHQQERYPCDEQQQQQQGQLVAQEDGQQRLRMQTLQLHQHQHRVEERGDQDGSGVAAVAFAALRAAGGVELSAPRRGEMLVSFEKGEGEGEEGVDAMINPGPRWAVSGHGGCLSGVTMPVLASASAVQGVRGQSPGRSNDSAGRCSEAEEPGRTNGNSSSSNGSCNGSGICSGMAGLDIVGEGPCCSSNGDGSRHGNGQYNYCGTEGDGEVAAASSSSLSETSNTIAPDLSEGDIGAQRAVGTGGLSPCMLFPTPLATAPGPAPRAASSGGGGEDKLGRPHHR